MARRTQLMEIDLLVAIIILFAGLIAIKSLYIHSYDSPQLQSSSQDAINALQTMQVKTIGQAAMLDIDSQLGAAGSSIRLDGNETIARQLLIMLIQGENNPNVRSQAERLAMMALQGVMEGKHYNITVLSNDQRYALASSNEPMTRAAAQSRTMLTGLQVERPVYGYAATAYLSGGTSEQARYTYLGGFVGQGNITMYLDLPLDIDIAADIVSLVIEGDFHSPFDLGVNGGACTSITPDHADPFVGVTRRDLTACASRLLNGRNVITLDFTSANNDDHYVGGGYLKASYIDDEIYAYRPSVTKRHYLPGISGVFNLYDGFYVPGRITSMDINLSYHSDHTHSNNTVFFTLGNRLLYTDNSSTTAVNEVITNAEILAAVGSYDSFERSTVPFRMGFDNGSLDLLASSVIDAVLVTDVSGSMAWRFDTDSSTNSYDRSCNDPLLYDVSTRRLSVAKCASKNFTSLILNDENQFLEPNRVGLVSYSSSLSSSFALTTSETAAVAEIDRYAASGSTCICCGILGADNIIRNDRHDTDWDNVTRAMIILTDGVANVATTTCINTVTNWGPYAAVPGVGDLDGINGADRPGDYAVAAANYSLHEHNIRIYTVGFGTLDRIDEQTLQAIAAVDNDTHFYLATDPQALTEIYNDIARDIIRIADYNAQVISFTVDVMDSVLHPDSYIEYTYEPYELPSLNGKLLLDGERSIFGYPDICQAVNVNFPRAISPLEGMITSYSGNHWTEALVINNRQLYDITGYGLDYEPLGDPFSLGIPLGVLSRGPNAFTLTTADAPGDPAQCSPANKLVYTAAINNTFTVEGVYDQSEGCRWSYYVIGSAAEQHLEVPSGYYSVDNGPNTCAYTGTATTYNNRDVWQVLAYEVLSSFDLDGDGVLEVSFEEEELSFNAVRQELIPYLWGPALLEVTVWQ